MHQHGTGDARPDSIAKTQIFGAYADFFFAEFDPDLLATIGIDTYCQLIDTRLSRLD